MEVFSGKMRSSDYRVRQFSNYSVKHQSCDLMDNVITAGSPTPPPILRLSTCSLPLYPPPAHSFYFLYHSFQYNSLTHSLSVTARLPISYSCVKFEKKLDGGSEGKKEQCYEAVKMIVEAKEKQSSTERRWR